MIKAKNDPWEKAFAALGRFAAREGHCSTPRFHIEGGVSLGPWVSNQRYYKDKLSAERRRKLDALGFIWNWRDHLWEKGFDALLKFKRREGHCRVSSSHIEGDYKLGYWVSTQRRKTKRMSSERRRRLDKIGFIWNTKS